MQNRYAGDIGDFSKLGLLRVLQKAGLSIGVNWYLVPDESKTADGRHVAYLKREDCIQCDRDLCLKLERIVDSANRTVQALQETLQETLQKTSQETIDVSSLWQDTQGLQDPGDLQQNSEKDSQTSTSQTSASQTSAILPAVYFDDMLDFREGSKQEREEVRLNWHKKALEKLNGLDVIFLDPDNGLLVPSALGKRKENKYVRVEELADYYRQGSTVVYYQHKARRPDAYYERQQETLLEMPEFSSASGMGLKFQSTSQRFYFFLIQPGHRKVIEDALHQMLTNRWQKHFCAI